MWTTNYTSILSAGLPMKKRSFSILSLFVTGIFSLSVKNRTKALRRLWSAWFLSINRQVLWTRGSAFNDEIDTMSAWCCELILAGKQGENYHIINQLSPPGHQQSPIVPRRGSQHTLIWQHCIDCNWMYITLPFPDYVYTMFTQVPIKLLKDSRF